MLLAGQSGRCRLAVLRILEEREHKSLVGLHESAQARHGDGQFTLGFWIALRPPWSDSVHLVRAGALLRHHHAEHEAAVATGRNDLGTSEQIDRAQQTIDPGDGRNTLMAKEEPERSP